jgi:hypothetical protein
MTCIITIDGKCALGEQKCNLISAITLKYASLNDKISIMPSKSAHFVFFLKRDQPW